MASQGMARKRPAPGTSPAQYLPQNQMSGNAYSNGMGPQLSDDQFLQWGESAQPRNNHQDSSTNGYSSNQYPHNTSQASNQLTRRPVNQIATRSRGADDVNNGALLGLPDISVNESDGSWGDDLEELKRRAQIVKREAQSKRKGIPPFVQKLNSFLENDKDNAHLIRWSDDGNSFIVLDEDEFAKTLIPELFKHNNYASFVRQLNMYGFHKKVGLTDNSLKQSEKKNKSPSEYSNPYFRRGHPDLLWLIQKPKNAGAVGPKKQPRAREEGEAKEEEGGGGGNNYVEESASPTDVPTRHRPQLTLGHGDSTLSQEQFQNVQRELAAIRHQQSQITRMIGALKHEHEQLFQQAGQYQEQHTRHENSINAILTFLATVYNRSLQGHEGAPGITNLFGVPGVSGAIPRENQGNVVDVGDYSFNDMDGVNGGSGRPFKRQPLLLTDGQEGRATTMTPSSTNSPFPARQTRRSSQNYRAGQTPLPANAEEVFDAGSTPLSTTDGVGGNMNRPANDIMSVIQNTNAGASQPGTPIAEFSSILDSLENSGGNIPLTNSQRADMLRIINNSTRQPGDNALINSTPPQGPNNYDRRLATTSADLDNLARLQAEQDKSVQNLTNLLQPLSPTGSIPGIGDGQNLPPPPLDIDEFLNHNEYFADFPSDGNGNLDFSGNGDSNIDGGLNYDDDDDDDEMFGNVRPSSEQQANENTNYGNFGADDHDGHGRIESVSTSEATTPNSGNANTVDGPTTRSRGRQLSSAGDTDVNNPAFKRARRS